MTSLAAGQLSLHQWGIWAAHTGLPLRGLKGHLKSQVRKELSCLLGVGAGLVDFPSVGSQSSCCSPALPAAGWEKSVRESASVL